MTTDNFPRIIFDFVNDWRYRIHEKNLLDSNLCQKLRFGLSVLLIILTMLLFNKLVNDFRKGNMFPDFQQSRFSVKGWVGCAT